MSTLERAIAIAAEAHGGVLDKGGQPYILHPLRVLLSVGTIEERIAAALHDVVEDSDWTLERLHQEGFSEPVVVAVDALTRRKGEEYMDFVRRAGANPIARRVKLADLADNMNPNRIASPSPRDAERMRKYEAAVALLEDPASEGRR